MLCPNAWSVNRQILRLKLEQPRMCSLMAKRIARNVSVGYNSSRVLGYNYWDRKGVAVGL